VWAGRSYCLVAHQFFLYASTITGLNQDRHLPTWSLFFMDVPSGPHLATGVRPTPLPLLCQWSRALV
jgi:hypothetical protein